MCEKSELNCIETLRVSRMLLDFSSKRSHFTKEFSLSVSGISSPKGSLDFRRSAHLLGERIPNACVRY